MLSTLFFACCTVIIHCISPSVEPHSCYIQVSRVNINILSINRSVFNTKSKKIKIDFPIIIPSRCRCKLRVVALLNLFRIIRYQIIKCDKMRDIFLGVILIELQVSISTLCFWLLRTHSGTFNNHCESKKPPTCSLFSLFHPETALIGIFRLLFSLNTLQLCPGLYCLTKAIHFG